MFYKGEYLFDPYLLTQTSELTNSELGPIIWYQMSTYNIFPYEVLNFLGSYLGDWLGFDPFGEVLNGNDKVFHLANDQRERPIP